MRAARTATKSEGMNIELLDSDCRIAQARFARQIGYLNWHSAFEQTMPWLAAILFDARSNTTPKGGGSLDIMMTIIHRPPFTGGV